MEDEYYETEVPVMGMLISAILGAAASFGISRLIQRRRQKKVEEFVKDYETTKTNIVDEIVQMSLDGASKQEIEERLKTEGTFLEIIREEGPM